MQINTINESQMMLCRHDAKDISLLNPKNKQRMVI